MSTTAQPATSGKAARLERYLREQLASEGELYFKSKFIAEEVELSAKEIGALMVQLRDSIPDLDIEKWSYTSATTWRVSPAE